MRACMLVVFGNRRWVLVFFCGTNRFAILDTDRSVAYPTTAYYQEPNATTAGSQDWKILTTYSASTTDGIRIAVTPLPD